MGICHVIEGRRVFEHLTPHENLEAAAPISMSRQKITQEKTRIYEYFPRLAERRTAHAGYLSGGEQQMLAIGRAMMTQPRLLMLDEPSLGLAPFLVAEIFGIIQRINLDNGVSVLLVEQNALAALKIVSHGYLIENGRVVLYDRAKATAHVKASTTCITIQGWRSIPWLLKEPAKRWIWAVANSLQRP